MRLIDADALKDAIVFDTPYYQYGDERYSFSTICKTIDAQPTSKVWISVEDRKPASQDDKILMVVDRNGSWGVEAGIYINHNGIDYWCGERGFLNSLEAKVIKWQYFPKP